MFSGEVHARPAPPSRRSTIRTSAPTAPLTQVELGELRNLSDQDLFAIGPAKLQAALKFSWEHNDEMAACIELAHLRERGLRDKLDDAVSSLTEAVARYEEAQQDQSRLESEVQGRNDLLDRLRRRLTMKEAKLRDIERRYAEQETSFEAERLAFLSQEASLRAQISSRTTPLRLSSPVTERDHAENEALREELEMTAASREALEKHLDALMTEVHDLKNINSQLRDENNGWQTLLTDQTVSGSIKKGSGVLARVLSGARMDEGGMLPPVLSRNESQRKMFSTWPDHSIEHEGDEPPTDISGDLEDRHLGEYAPDHFDFLRSTQIPKGESLENIPVTGSGLDLAAELGRAEVHEGGEMRALGKGDEGEALRAEVKHLRDANKSLSMYCSKIIDRIIAKEGYEDVLNVDYTNDQATSESSRRPPQRSEPSARHHESILAKSDIVDRPAEQIKGERRARRGISMDWGLGKVFKSFSGPTKPPETTRPGLRPLSLSMNPAGLSTTSTLGAHKLGVHEEDEEDARERHRMQAALKLMGVVEETEAPLPSQSRPPAERGAGRYWLPGLHRTVENGQNPTPQRTQKAHNFVIEP